MYEQPSAFNNPAAAMMGQNSAGSMFCQQQDMFGGSFGGFGMRAASAMGSMGQPTVARATCSKNKLRRRNKKKRMMPS